GGVLGAHGVDAVVADALTHQDDQVRPDRVPFGPGQIAACPVRVDSVPEEDLGAVDVADACDHLLVHEQGGDRGPAAGDAVPGGLGVGAGAKGVRAEAVVYRPLLA